MVWGEFSRNNHQYCKKCFFIDIEAILKLSPKIGTKEKEEGRSEREPERGEEQEAREPTNRFNFLLFWVLTTINNLRIF